MVILEIQVWISKSCTENLKCCGLELFFTRSQQELSMLQMIISSSIQIHLELFFLNHRPVHNVDKKCVE